MEETKCPPVFRELTRRYIHRHRMIQHSRLNFLLFMLKIPFVSRWGGHRLETEVQDTLPERWTRDFSQKRVLIVGSGPSLDRVQPAWFEQFDTILHINFAIRKARGRAGDYFFTTDIGPVREYLDAYDESIFRSLGPERCLFAPIWLDQYPMLTELGRGLFSILKYDKATWQAKPVRLGRVRLPLMLRYYPRQPDWESFTMPPPGRSLPIIAHTSALTAVVFAAMMGAESVGLIGCDFSAGRAASSQSTQDAPTDAIFASAPHEFRRIQAMLARHGTEVVNHSWLV